MSDKFWFYAPYTLVDKNAIVDLWPTTQMSYERKLNAITRLLIVLTLFGFLFTGAITVLMVGVLTCLSLVLVYKYRYFSPKDGKKPGPDPDPDTKKKVETFQNRFPKSNSDSKSDDPSEIVLETRESLEKHLQSSYHDGKKKNPFNNVLLTEIHDAPDRKSAPPSFHPTVEENIQKNVKRSVQFMNSGIDNTNKQLFSSLWDNFLLDQSNRVFYSTANTRIEPGDQAALGQYLYGNMPSSKESNLEAAIARVQDSYRYTLY